MQNTNTVWKTETVVEPTGYRNLSESNLQTKLNQLSKEGWTIFSVQKIKQWESWNRHDETDIMFLITAYKSELPTLPKAQTRFAAQDMIAPVPTFYH